MDYVLLGLGDVSTAIGVIGCLLVTLFGVIYGLFHWNKEN